MKHLSLLIAAVVLVLTQCERHSWEDVTDEHGHVTEKGTKRLYEVHGGGSGDAHGAGHDADAEAHDKDGGEHKSPEQGHDGDGTADH